jgi:AcrR family transcriptional regulator
MSLRERNRLSTWSAIHEAAARMALDEGLDQATVAAISAAAGVSARSFFNYFPTKEDAVLGLRGATVSDDSVARFQAPGPDLLTRTVRLTNEVLRSMLPEDSHTGHRRALVRKYPELRARIIQRIAEAEDLTLSVVSQELLGSPTGPGPVQHAEPEEGARALVMLAGVITRFAYARAQFPLPSDSAALDRAINTFRTLIEDRS